MDNARNPSIIRAKIHHHMAGFKQQVSRLGRTDHGIPLLRCHSLRIMLHRHGPLLLICIARKKDPHALVYVLDKGRTIYALILSAPSIDIPQKTKRLMDRLLSAVWQISMVQRFIKNSRRLIGDQASISVFQRKDQPGGAVRLIPAGNHSPHLIHGRTSVGRYIFLMIRHHSKIIRTKIIQPCRPIGKGQPAGIDPPRIVAGKHKLKVSIQAVTQYEHGLSRINSRSLQKIIMNIIRAAVPSFRQREQTDIAALYGHSITKRYILFRNRCVTIRADRFPCLLSQQMIRCIDIRSVGRQKVLHSRINATAHLLSGQVLRKRRQILHRAAALPNLPIQCLYRIRTQTNRIIMRLSQRPV